MATQSESRPASAKDAKLHFSRFEFKYILPQAQRDELETQFQYFVELDPFVAEQPNSKYFVRSLYFDNEIRSNYWEKENGVKHRQKFRLRTYTGDASSGTPQFLEIKGRHNNLVFKHRTPLNASGEPGNYGLPYPDAATEDVLSRIDAGPIRERFEYELHRKNIRPVTLVDYWRRPYISKYDAEFRLTFDDSLRGWATDRLFPPGSARSRSILSGYTILEVKFRFHLPKWFHRLIQSNELRRVSVSKFCACMRGLEQVSNPD